MKALKIILGNIIAFVGFASFAILINHVPQTPTDVQIVLGLAWFVGSLATIIGGMVIVAKATEWV